MAIRLAEVVITIILFSTSAFTARSYFVSPAGSDSLNSGTSLSSPFRTIQKAASLAQAGDSVRIRAGVYHETVRPANSGTTGAPIIFMPYNNEKAVISGADTIKGWTLDAGSVYKANTGWRFASGINQANQVFVDGVMINLARWPNTSLDISNPKKSRVSRQIGAKSAVGTMTRWVIEDDSLQPQTNGYYTGALVYLQPDNGGWSWVTTGYVSAQNGKQLTLDVWGGNGADGSANLAAGARYYLFNRKNQLDANGEWWSDSSAQVLYLRTPDGSSPSTHLIEMKRRDYAFNLDSRSCITIKGITLFAATITTDIAAGDGIGHEADGAPHYGWRSGEATAAVSHIVIDGLRARYLSHFTDLSGHMMGQWGNNTGLVLGGSDITVRNCILQYCAGNGITIMGNRNLVDNNDIRDMNYMATECGFVGTSWSVVARDLVIANNTMYNTGRSGLQLRTITNTTPSALLARVHHNDIGNFMLQDHDGGAFYMVGHDAQFTRIDHNWFHVDFDVNRESGSVMGAYWDFSKNCVFDHNVIWGVRNSVQVTGEYQNTGVNNLLVYNNTVLSRGDWGRPFVTGNSQAADGSINKGSVVRNNIFQVGVFPNPNGPGNVNNWPAYADASDASKNLVWGDDPAGYYSKADYFNTRDDYAAGAGFADTTRHDYRLQTNSPAKDNGIVFPSNTIDDITVPAYNDPVVGSAPDQGAYEYGGTYWAPGAVIDTSTSTPVTPAALHGALSNSFSITGTRVTAGIGDVKITVYDLAGRRSYTRTIHAGTSFNLTRTGRAKQGYVVKAAGNGTVIYKAVHPVAAAQ